MIKIAICDDIASEREELQSILLMIQNAEQNWNFDITQYASGELLFMDLEEQCIFDLIILDIYMDGMSGMEIAHKIRQREMETPIVFLTASPDFALESYDVNAFGYLLKPIDADKLTAVLERLLVYYDRPRVSIQCDRRRRYLFLDEIMYVKSQNHNIYIHLVKGEMLTSGEKLNDLEEKMDDRFLRCHQSYLVNMCFIADVAEDFILKDGTRIPIRKRQHKAIADTYYRFFVKHTLKS